MVAKARVSALALSFSLLIGANHIASAAPSATFSAVTVEGSTTFNGTQQAICSGSTVTVDVTVTPSYDSSGSCLNLGGSPPLRRTATGSGTVAVTANGTALTCTSSSTGGLCSGSIPVGSEGIDNIAIAATVTDGNTASSCSGGTSAAATKTTSTKYVLDQTPPTLAIQSYSPGPCATCTIPTIQQGDSLTVHTQMTDGSSGTSLALKFSGYMDSTTIGPSEVDGTFGGPSGNDNGKAPTKNNDVVLNTTCDTAPGIYTAKVEADTKNLCGTSYSAIVNDPAATHGGASGNNSSGTFEVLASGAELHDTALVISEFPTGDYGLDQCFTSAVPTRKVVSNPGTVHLASIISATSGSGPCAAEQISDVVDTLQLPDGFKWDRTGSSPLAHVFVGLASNALPLPGFDLHSGAPLTEVTSSAVITQIDSTHATVDLSNVDVGEGPGVIPLNDVVYVRAHAIWASTTIPAPKDAIYEFTDTATATPVGGTGTITASNTVDIVSNPTCDVSHFVCSDGTDDSTSCQP